MKTYSYLLEHDYGLAPNPFGKYCTLGVCKPKIRGSRNLEIGDWVIGTGSRALENISGRDFVHHIIYAMKVEEILSYEKYWSDIRFAYKKPILNGSLVTVYGDNIYHKDNNGNWIQEDSAHSLADGVTNEEHLRKDTSGKNVLISKDFYYFGDSAPLLPKDLFDVCHSGVGEKIIKSPKQDKLIGWLKENFHNGIHGDPINWIEHNQLNLF
ncbi:hypothetical protein [Flavobacterium chungangensis]|uniref:Nucleotide modification associated domain-containing protein n=1 Tax=Flavobacterium chungangensis TaxID=2708132 RepID=A0ABV8ZEJ1_9FLAO